MNKKTLLAVLIANLLGLVALAVLPAPTPAAAPATAAQATAPVQADDHNLDRLLDALTRHQQYVATDLDGYPASVAVIEVSSALTAAYPQLVWRRVAAPFMGYIHFVEQGASPEAIAQQLDLLIEAAADSRPWRDGL